MTTLKSKSGKKAVNISNNNGVFYAVYVQFVNTGTEIVEQVLLAKSYSSESAATKWANKQLS